MSTARVTVEQIKEALKLTRGDMSKASRVLGIARNNLYKRCANSKIDVTAYRDNTPIGNGVTGVAHSSGAAAARKGSARATVVHLSTAGANAIFPRSTDGRSLPNMSSAANATEGPKTLRAARTVYFRPDHLQLIDDACLDLPAVLREKLSFSRFLEMLLDERGVEWIKEKLAAAAHARADEEQNR